MVLKRRGSSGVTLIELLLALSMSSLIVGMALALFRDIGFAARLGQGHRDAAFRAQAMLSSLSENLMTGGGILHLGPGRLEVLNARRQRMEYRWGEDSLLTVNGRPAGFRLASLALDPQGPRRPDEPGSAFVGDPWDLDSLDGDRDGTLGFEELDRDRDGELDPGECRLISLVKVTLITVERGIPATLTCVVHPRNRVSGAGEAADRGEADPSEGIPEP